MNPEMVAKMLRDLAADLESGVWGSVDVELENDLRDKPRTWRDGGQYRGKDLVGRTITLRLGCPGKGAP